ncbi:DNA gyrase/topoisomerase IV subunit A [Mycoplasma phocimorsus]|uniref:DNA gyrase/topoisomerase IV subunit A n=1 Tax=Mycoplasma phocimorsus TaxID=3045839 RepID=UPI0024C02183|nr:DNA topoisomerase IV subunit A [Mycoplasma phocimorsus]MDJ1648916.1 DNA topoisomerase IV subunit A [Mycoplasma phocimorsus]
MKNKFINQNIINQSLDLIMNDRFGRYSKYIIQQRALPDARDGLKPVQRRILYSMFELNLTNDKPFKKSARVVGDVIGKYHPHGDSSIYEAMVRMAQSWKMNVPLVNMHGNVGSIDDDPAAAMRYTEAKLSKITNLMLNDLEKNTVKFTPNFDDSEQEPTVLPSIIPNLLLNGAKGIASGFATDMPPHNLSEIIDAAIAKIKNPSITTKGLMKHIKGPDFPTGGIIYGVNNLEKVYETGNGRITLVAKKIFSGDNKNKYIEVIEIPYGVIKSKLVYDIDKHIQSGEISGLVEVKDQSDRNGISILITLTKEADHDSIWNFLASKTELQVYYNVNNVAIVENAPKLLSLNKLLDSYLNHVIEIKYKTINFDLEKSLKRLEIVNGFIKLSQISNEVIETIRNSSNSRLGVINSLIKIHNFTENQAKAIADLRLYKLSLTDQQAYLQQKEELEKSITFYRNLLNDKAEFNKWLIFQLQEIKKEYGFTRRTQIETDEFSSTYNKIDLLKVEEIYIGLSSHGYIKKLTKSSYNANEIESYKLKPDDFLVNIIKTNSTSNLLLFTDHGRYANVPIYKISETKWKDLGDHISNLIDIHSGESVISMIAVDDFESVNYIVIATKYAMIKRIALKELQTSRTNLMSIIKLKEKDYVIGACESNNEMNILLISEQGNCNKYFESDIPIYGKSAQGIKGCNLKKNDYISVLTLVKNNMDVLFISNIFGLKKINLANIESAHRQVIGKKLFEQSKTKKHIITLASEVNSKDKVIFRADEVNNVINTNAILPTLTSEKMSKIMIKNIIGATILKDNAISSSVKRISKPINIKQININKQQEKQIDDKLLEIESSINFNELEKKLKI